MHALIYTLKKLENEHYKHRDFGEQDLSTDAADLMVLPRQIQQFMTEQND